MFSRSLLKDRSPSLTNFFPAATSNAARHGTSHQTLHRQVHGVKAEVLDLLQTESSNRALAHALSVENEDGAFPVLSVKLMA